MAKLENRYLTGRYPPNIKRSTIIWSLPKSGMLSEYDIRSSKSIYSSDDRIFIRMYINPETVGINDSKIINETLTKGGYTVQYWGEKNTTISLNGTTGSSGIEGINVLNRVYRHEQYEFENILKARVAAAKEKIKASVVENAAKLNNIQSGPRISTVPSALSDGIETIMDVFSGNKGSIDDREWEPIKTYESLGALATTIEMHYDGVIYQGYFTTFSVTENATSPGLFTYSMNFTVLRREGVRDNFMPWHRSPYDSGGDPKRSSTPRESYVNWNLTFPYSNTEYFREVEHSLPSSRLTEQPGPADADTANQSIKFKPTSRK